MTSRNRIARLRSHRVQAAAALGTAVALAGLATAAFASQASATSDVLLIGPRESESFSCAVATHGVDTNTWPLEQVENGCGTRVWLHGTITGWSYCVSPGKDVDVPDAYKDPENAQVTANTAAC